MNTVDINEEMLKKLNSNFTTKKLFGAWGDNPGSPAAEYLVGRKDFSEILNQTIAAGVQGLEHGYELDYGYCVALYVKDKGIYVVIGNTIDKERPLPITAVFGIQYISDDILDVLAYIAAAYR